MAATVQCPSCSRPNGLRFRRCMYCAAELPPPPDPAAADEDPADSADEIAERAKKAKALLATLSPAARAMMPPEVLEKLRRDAKALPRSAAPAEATPSQAPASSRPLLSIAESRPASEPRRSARGSAADEPVPLPPPAVGDLMERAVAPVPELAVEPLPGPGGGRSDPYVDALRAALVRGGGPFGRRDRRFRFILMPRPEYREKVHFLKHRIASVFDLDLYTAVQSLQRDVPRFVGAFDDPAEARAAIVQLRDGGMAVSVLDREALRSWGGPRRVAAIEDIRSDRVKLRLVDGSRGAVQRADLLGAYFAEIEPDREVAYNPMTLRGGPPGRARTDGSALDGGGAYVLLDILVRGSLRPLRFRSDEFDSAILGADRALSAGLNLRRVAGLLALPGTPVTIDQRFRRVPHFAAPKRADEVDEVAARIARREIEFSEYVLAHALEAAGPAVGVG